MINHVIFLNMIGEARSLLKTTDETNVFADLLMRYTTGRYRDEGVTKADVNSAIDHATGRAVKHLDEGGQNEEPIDWAKRQMKSTLWPMMRDDGLTMDQSVGLYLQNLREQGQEINDAHVIALRKVVSEVHFEKSTPSGVEPKPEDKVPQKEEPVKENDEHRIMVNIVFEGEFNNVSGSEFPHIGMIQGAAKDRSGQQAGGDIGSKRIDLQFTFPDKAKADEFIEYIAKEYARFQPKIYTDSEVMTEGELYSKFYDALNDAIHNLGWEIIEQTDDEIAVKTDGGKPVSDQSRQNAKEIAEQFGLELDIGGPKDVDVVFMLPDLQETTTAAAVAATAIPMPMKQLSGAEKEDIKKGKYKGEPVGKYMRLLKKRMAQDKTQSKPYGA
jgi:hypothetical protein